MQWIIICDASPAGRPKKEEFMTFSRVCILQMTHFKSTWAKRILIFFVLQKITVLEKQTKSLIKKSSQKMTFFFFFWKSRILNVKLSNNLSTFSENRKKNYDFQNIFKAIFWSKNRKILDFLMKQPNCEFRKKIWIFAPKMNSKSSILISIWKNETFFTDFQTLC